MLNSFSCSVNFSVVLSMVAARVIYVPLGVICGSFEWLVTGLVSEGTVMGCWLANALLSNTPDGLKIILARPDDTSSRSLAFRPLHHG